MKFILSVAYFVLSVTLFSNSVFASNESGDELSCDNIEEAIIVLSVTLDELEHGNMGGDSGDDELFDMRLGMVAETAREFAEVEDDDILIYHSEIMIESWDNEDAESFIDSGQAMIEYYHDLFDRDC